MNYLMSEPHASIDYFDAPGIELAVVTTENQKMALLHEIFDAHFRALGEAIGAGKIQPIGPALARYTRMDEANQECDLQIGFPVATPLSEPIQVGDVTIHSAQIPAGRTARISHFGAYDGLAQAWSTLVTEVLHAGHTPDDACYEVYVSEPTPETDPAALRTDLYLPVE